MRDEAIAEYRRAIELKANYPSVRKYGDYAGGCGRQDEAIAAFRKSLELRPDAETHGNMILSMHYHPDYDAQAIARELARWNEKHAVPLPRLPAPAPRTRRKKIRIGYVSPDLRDHVVGQNLMPLLSNHDREKFEIYCYAQVPTLDWISERIQKHSDVWRSTVGMSDEAVAEQIRADEIDILVDLALHTGHNRLMVFARKPAGVGDYLAYAGSSGLAAMDYRLSDPYLDHPAPRAITWKKRCDCRGRIGATSRESLRRRLRYPPPPALGT